MKKILFSLACMVSFVLAFTSCNGNDNYYYYSNLTGIYTSTSATDTSTVILAPSGQKDMIMIQYQNGTEMDSIYLTPTVTLDNVNNIGAFSDTSTGWQGNFVFSNYGQKAILTMTNQKTGQTLPAISLTKSQFGHTLAGAWADSNNPTGTNMKIVLCRPGYPDRGEITFNGGTHEVFVYGPSTRYGNGSMYIEGSGWADYQLSALDEDASQYILITFRDGTMTLEMSRLIGQ